MSEAARLHITQDDGSVFVAKIGDKFRCKRSGRALMLLEVHLGMQEVSALFIDEAGAKQWRDLSRSFPKDYERIEETEKRQKAQENAK